MKKILFLLLTLFLAYPSFCQEKVYTKPCTDKALIKKAKKWMKKGGWRNGLTYASPDKSVDAVEFYTQYQKNPKQWNDLFEWVAKTDLLALSKGRHPIEGTGLVANVEDDVNKPMSERKCESHYHHIDFQFAVKGTERFGLAEHNTSKPNCEYNAKGDIIFYDYDPNMVKIRDSKPDKFFLFFPSNWHIPKVEAPKGDQHIRVVVVKIDYIE